MALMSPIQPELPKPSKLTTVVVELSPAGGGWARGLENEGYEGHCRGDCGLPPVGQTLWVGEALHRGVIRKAAEGKRIDCPELTGQDWVGQPLAGPHRHVHFLPLDVDEDGFLEHVVIHAAMGLSDVAISAIRTLRMLYGRGGKPWLRLRVVADVEGLGWNELIWHRLVSAKCTSKRIGLAGSRVWVSLTPFVAPRYVKRSGRNTLEGQIRAELASRGLPDAAVEILPIPDGAPWDYVLRRSVGHAPPPQCYGHCVRLKFAEPITGPLTLGYASHFGLGLFQVEGSA
jgi:CRISPR-associated protein Csb2